MRTIVNIKANITAAVLVFLLYISIGSKKRIFMNQQRLNKSNSSKWTKKKSSKKKIVGWKALMGIINFENVMGGFLGCRKYFPCLIENTRSKFKTKYFVAEEVVIFFSFRINHVT